LPQLQSNLYGRVAEFLSERRFDLNPSPNVTERPNFTNQTNFGAGAPLSSWQEPQLPAQNPPSYMSPQMSMAQGQNQTLPTISMVLGIFSLILICCYGISIPLGAAAAITGYMGMNNANNNPSQFGGKGLAVAGMICGAISLVVGAFWLLLIIAGSLS
jgi:hypothetical protein